MIHVVLEHYNGCEEYEYYLERDEYSECQKSDRKWMEIVGKSNKWDFLTYSHDDFVQVASDPKKEHDSE
jgi:hypothetical protein